MFTPKGDRAEWRVIYDHTRTMTPGEVLTYERISGLLGRDSRTGRGPL